ncbi:transposase [Pyxidicoccus fallax]|uniref:Rpn family recombination-promoting nuclease/putative transposase n=1 Tax=Pyxidicoccus fallax TaxID=394095 RepID=A0A848LQZ9_9BACT|nr:Rpn family recombination-promoting nuclease/putative transposase [Pyxidicoccus fallax]NMO20072.1 Rpn family recombination-promoting nuclease/putative transposase [Pyxidicoccus fallax]NPC80682.1 transposase [Pyxidicoccus fallax]
MPGPHDLFVRFTFSHPERAAAELRAVLPPAVVSEVDWSTLRRESSSVVDPEVDPELRETQSDLLFSARLLGGGPVLLYVLLEHQSSVDRWMALRMLRYVVRQLEHWRKEHPESERLPVIVPLVMYHGPEGGWSAPRRVEELFELPGPPRDDPHWRELVPRFAYLLDDLTTERAEALMARPGPPLVRLALLVLRFGRTEELARRLPDWKALFAELEARPGAWDELVALVRYILQVGDRATRTAMADVLASATDARRAEELMKTYAEELIEEGMSKGLARSVLRVLHTRGLGLDDRARQRILSCTDPDVLERWLERALSATSLADVFG